MNLEQARTLEGTFWLPSYTDGEHLEGALTIATDGSSTLVLSVPRRLASFTTSGFSDQDREVFLGVPFAYGTQARVDDWIVGRLADGRYAALRNCRYLDGHLAFLAQKPVVRVRVLGGTLLSPQDFTEEPSAIRLTSVRFKAQPLDVWFSNSGIKHDPFPLEPESQSITMALPSAALQLRLTVDEVPCALKFRHYWDHASLGELKGEVTQRVYATVHSDKPQPVLWFRRTVQQFLRFVSFVSSTWAPLEQLRGKAEARATAETGGLAYSHEIFFGDGSPPGSLPPVRWTEMFFTSDSMTSERLQQVVQAWFDFHNSKRTRAVPLLHTTASLRNDVLENRCVNITAALGKLSGPDVEKSEARAAYDEIDRLLEASGAAQGTRDWFDTLKKRHLFGESKREQFFRLMSSSGLDALMGEEQCRAVAGQLARLRQAVVYGARNPDLGLYWLALAVLDVCVLSRLGFTKDELRRIVTRSDRLRTDLQLTVPAEHRQGLSGIGWLTGQ